MWYRSVALIVLLVLPFEAAESATGELAGVVKTTKGRVELRPSGGRKRPAIPGTRVHVNDRLITGANGQALLQFRDQTVFLLGPGGDLKIDRFVYNPDRGIGEMIGSLARGLFRLISGQIPKMSKSEMALKTPVASIGIRGTVALGEITSGQTAVVLLDPAGGPADGAIIVTSPGGSVFLREPFDGTDVVGSGTTPVPTAKWSEQRVRDLLRRLGDTAMRLPSSNPTTPRRTDTPEPTGPVLAIPRDSCRRVVQLARRLARRDPTYDVGGGGPAERAARSRAAPESLDLRLSELTEMGIQLTEAEVAATYDPVIIRNTRVRVAGRTLSPTQHVAFAKRCARAYPRF